MVESLYPLFLIVNGCSYLFSAATESWIKVPNKKRNERSRKFIESTKRGYYYVGHNEGLKQFLLLCCIMNFFLCLTEILYIPFFNGHPNGINMYGYCMSALSVGTIISAVFTSSLKGKINTRKWFIITAIGYFLLASIFPFQKNPYCFMIIFAAMGCVDAIMHNIISSCLQLNTHSDFRGVVFFFI